MIRRLLTLVLALALLPIAVPRGATGSRVGRRHGTTAERFTSHGPVALFTESLFERSARDGSARRHKMSFAVVTGRRVLLFGEPASRRQSNAARSLLQGAALVPLRI